MTAIRVPTSQAVILVNQFICKKAGNTHFCRDINRIESALQSAFYPGTSPFAAGGLAKVAGALCYYLVQGHAFEDGNKRTGALVAITFLNENGWDLKYPIHKKKDYDALAEVILKCASSNLSKEELMDWFELHKVPLE